MATFWATFGSILATFYFKSSHAVSTKDGASTSGHMYLSSLSFVASTKVLLDAPSSVVDVIKLFWGKSRFLQN